MLQLSPFRWRLHNNNFSDTLSAVASLALRKLIYIRVLSCAICRLLSYSSQHWCDGSRQPNLVQTVVIVVVVAVVNVLAELTDKESLSPELQRAGQAREQLICRASCSAYQLLG